MSDSSEPVEEELQEAQAAFAAAETAFRKAHADLNQSVANAKDASNMAAQKLAQATKKARSIMDELERALKAAERAAKENSRSRTAFETRAEALDDWVAAKRRLDAAARGVRLHEFKTRLHDRREKRQRYLRARQLAAASLARKGSQ